MPNRDHDDTPYNRYEGRYESPRTERDDSRESYRSARDYDRNFDDPLRRAERNRAQFDGGFYDRNRDYNRDTGYARDYNPARDEHDYRGGSRFEERGRSFQGVDPIAYGARSRDDWRYRETPRAGQYGSTQGSYGSDWTRSGDYDARNEWSPDYRTRSDYSRSSYGQTYGAPTDWNRDYTRDANRGRSNFETPRDYRRDDNDWGEQIRHASHQVIGKVKRAFRGPKGYKRSDDRIREDVNDRLAQQDELDPSDIEVQVQNGDVTLTGTVRNRHEKFRAEEIADEISGVNDVHNQLRVGEPQAQTSAATSATGTLQNGDALRSRNGRA